ncbi:MAG: elongation factor P maturation arginine rhamnosyltransferase EarP [Moraxellaceae bacterium]|nr:MAG: elongation factor P maturation arginine rhamnosyltransferase EarP [Moraxellaceae bacterium]
MRCAIFCNIIDNFGDIGVCWRLARQLTAEYQLSVSLFVDDLHSFAILAPQLQPELPVQPLGQITVHHWQAQTCFDQPYDLIIEGFGCRLGDPLLRHMQQQAAAGQPPLWINLEYMSAETWVMDCHGMVSVHPATGLKQTFWFPSTTPHSGGLIREQTLLAERDQFQHDHHLQTEFWNALGLSDAIQFSRKISLFSYENTAIAELLTALAQDSISTLLLVPKSKSIPDIEVWLQQQAAYTQQIRPPLQINDRIQFQNLTIVVLPFLSHYQYDQLLWACELNFIRGEDSCVRAQWAGKPFIWHIYPQHDNAHLTKLQAWMDQIEQQGTIASSWQAAMKAWNRNALSLSASSHPVSDTAMWQRLMADLPSWTHQLANWSHYLTQQSDLAARLIYWIEQNQQG